ncbi:MAG: hypothetical protein WCY19_05760 [Candidatus Gastranaerophilaceae bacterium]
MSDAAVQKTNDLLGLLRLKPRKDKQKINTCMSLRGANAVSDAAVQKTNDLLGLLRLKPRKDK